MKRTHENEAHIFCARKGLYKGVESVFTHRDPDTGLVWGEDLIRKGELEPGMWVEPGSVKWLD